MPSFISRNYTTQHFPNGPQTIDDRILLFTDRVRGWQLDPAIRCIRNDPHAGFAALHIIVSYFEVIGMLEFDANTHAYLRKPDGSWEGGKKFSFEVLDSARYFYQAEPMGSWSPTSLMAAREVLILGTGPGVAQHRRALEAYIQKAKPLVMALNTQIDINGDLIDLRVACHPVRIINALF